MKLTDEIERFPNFIEKISTNEIREYRNNSHLFVIYMLHESIQWHHSSENWTVTGSLFIWSELIMEIKRITALCRHKRREKEQLFLLLCLSIFILRIFFLRWNKHKQMDSGWLLFHSSPFSVSFFIHFVWSFSKWFPFVSILEMKRKCSCFLLLLKYSMALIWFSSPISEWKGSEKSWQTATEAAQPSTAKGEKGKNPANAEWSDSSEIHAPCLAFGCRL